MIIELYRFLTGTYLSDTVFNLPGAIIQRLEYYGLNRVIDFLAVSHNQRLEITDEKTLQKIYSVLREKGVIEEDIINGRQEREQVLTPSDKEFENIDWEKRNFEIFKILLDNNPNAPVISIIEKAGQITHEYYKYAQWAALVEIRNEADKEQ